MTTGATPTALPADSRLSAWLSYAVLLVGIGAGVASAYMVISTYSALPHWDEWALFDRLATGQGWSLPWLWAQHNEHRILVPKLFFLADVDLFRGTQVFLLASIFLIQLLQVALLSFSLRTLGAMRGAAWRTGTGLIAYCILCPTQYENLLWGFQLQFVIPAAMATLALLALLLYCREARVGLLVLSIAAATIATWSLANGMLLWPLLLLAALLLRMGRSVLLTIVASGTANIGLYLFHYRRPSPETELAPVFDALAKILQYIAVYFGSTFVRHSSGWIAVVLGVAGLCTAAAIIFRVLPQRGRDSLLLLQLSLLMLLCIATAAITASGRLHLGLEQATASRYQTFALLFWCSLGLSILFYTQKRPLRLNILAGSLLVLTLGFATQVRLPLMDAQQHQLRLKLVSLALLTGVHDPAVLADAYPDPRPVLRAMQYMQANHLSIFAGDLYRQLGQPLDATYRLGAPGDCSGSVSLTEVMHMDGGSGLRLTGFAWDNRRNRPARDIIAVTNDRITGFGANVSIPLNASAARPNSDPARFGWLAFVRDVPPGKVKLYAVVGARSREVCPFAEVSP